LFDHFIHNLSPFLIDYGTIIHCFDPLVWKVIGPDAASWCARECIASVDVAGCGTPIEQLYDF